MSALTSIRQLVGRAFPRFRSRGHHDSTPVQIWSIGVYTGDSPFGFHPGNTVENPVLTGASVSDVPAAFVADPFMVHINNVWHLFFEVMNSRSGKGEIGLATSEDCRTWTYQNIVLKEDFHLSYPYVFEWEGSYYMTPESCHAKCVRLYKATDFPQQWSPIADLLAGDLFADPSVFQFEKRWWLFTDSAGSPYHAGTLRLFSAPTPLGPWIEHPKSPILRDAPHMARPSGRVVIYEGKPIRYTQDCYLDYGSQVRAFEILELTASNYTEREVKENPILAAGIWQWNESGMHHIDPHRINDGKWIACVDGFHWRRSVQTQ